MAARRAGAVATRDTLCRGVCYAKRGTNMSKSSWGGSDVFRRLRDEMDRLLRELSTTEPVAALWGGAQYPPLNVWETDGAFVVEAEIPGVPQSQLDIRVLGRELTLRGERPSLADDADRKVVHRHERGTGVFVRTLRLPAEVDADGAEARLENGVLTLRLPKQAAARARKVEVRSG
jgi:HSP20 family protein